jgi:hypothetical protein
MVSKNGLRVSTLVRISSERTAGAESAARAGLPEAYGLNRGKSNIMMMMKDSARGRKKGLFFIMTGNYWLS